MERPARGTRRDPGGSPQAPRGAARPPRFLTNPLGAMAAGMAIVALATILASALAWRSFDDVETFLWPVVSASAVATVAAAWIVARASFRRRWEAVLSVFMLPAGAAGLALVLAFPLAWLGLAVEPITTAVVLWAAAFPLGALGAVAAWRWGRRPS